MLRAAGAGKRLQPFPREPMRQGRQEILHLGVADESSHRVVHEPLDGVARVMVAELLYEPVDRLFDVQPSSRAELSLWRANLAHTAILPSAFVSMWPESG